MLIILRSNLTTVCPIWTTSKTRQIAERVGLSDRQRRGSIELWNSGGPDQFGDMRWLGGQRGAAAMLKEQARTLRFGSEGQRALIDGCLPTRSFGFLMKTAEGKILRCSSYRGKLPRGMKGPGPDPARSESGP